MNENSDCLSERETGIQTFKWNSLTMNTIYSITNYLLELSIFEKFLLVLIAVLVVINIGKFYCLDFAENFYKNNTEPSSYIISMFSLIFMYIMLYNYYHTDDIGNKFIFCILGIGVGVFTMIPVISSIESIVKTIYSFFVSRHNYYKGRKKYKKELKLRTVININKSNKE